MKIGQTNDTQRIGALPGVQEGRAPASNAPVEPVEAADRVELSPASRTLSAGASAGGADLVRQEKVEALRRAIQEGRFEVAAHAVADRMISEAAELIETIAGGGAR